MHNSGEDNMGQNKMIRSINQVLFKYLPGSYVDCDTHNGKPGYFGYVYDWNCPEITDINTARLLRFVSSQIQNYICKSPDKEQAVCGFPSSISESTVSVRTPNIDNDKSTVLFRVEPLTLVCTHCGHIEQYTNGKEFLSHLNEKCHCGGKMVQWNMVMPCTCGYIQPIRFDDCGHGHGNKSLKRKNNFDVICLECNKETSNVKPIENDKCPVCGRDLKMKTALDTANYFPFNFSLINLIRSVEDEFLEANPVPETNYLGEQIIASRYLEKINENEYQNLIKMGYQKCADRLSRLEICTDNDKNDFLDSLLFDDIDTISASDEGITDTNMTDNALRKVQNLSLANSVKQTAESLLEYQSLKSGTDNFDLEVASIDGRKINGNIEVDYQRDANKVGFTNATVCFNIPMVLASYGFTRNKNDSSHGLKLCSFSVVKEYDEKFNHDTVRNTDKGNKCNIYASKLNTSGVLFEFDRMKIINWLFDNYYIDELPDNLDSTALKQWFLDNVKLEKITKFYEIDDDKESILTKRIYTLIHSVSHSLIKAAVRAQSGLQENSLSEYILPDIPAVLIYCSNSQGEVLSALETLTLMSFDKWMHLAVDVSKKCISDPICIDKHKACANCLLIDEVMCEHYNKDIDRSYLCGHIDKSNNEQVTGFWEDQ